MEPNETSTALRLSLSAIVGASHDPEAGESVSIPAVIARTGELGTSVDEVGVVVTREIMERAIGTGVRELAGSRVARLTAAHTDALSLILGVSLRAYADALVIGAAHLGAALARPTQTDEERRLGDSVAALLPVLSAERGASAEAALSDAMQAASLQMPEITRAAITGAAISRGIEMSADGAIPLDLGASAAISLAVSAAVETIRRAGIDAMRQASAALADMADAREREGGGQ